MSKKLIFIENANHEKIGEKRNILYNGLVSNNNVTIVEDIDLCDYIFLALYKILSHLPQRN